MLFLAVPAQADLELLPVDDGARQPEFFAFRARLQVAIARRDAAAVLAAVDPRIKNSFGGDDGKAAFERFWKPRQSSSRLWSELGAVLALGGTFDGNGRFVAPYIFSRWPERFDAFQHVAVTGSRVRVRSAPRPDAPVIATLSFAIVPLAPQTRAGKPTPGWSIVRVGGRTGYISSDYVRSPVGYRAIFERRAGTWRMVFLVTGD